MKYQQNEYVYTKGAPLDEIFFVVDGYFGMVLPEYDDLVYVNIRANDYFGDIDYVYSLLFPNNEKIQNEQKRWFTVKAL
jgi:CRP-like cAMP-binding protein